MKKVVLNCLAMLITIFAKGQTFTNVISGSGIPVDRTWVHGVLDYNKDGYEDLLLSLGTSMPNDWNKRVLKIYKNNGNGTFSDQTTQAGLPLIDSIATFVGIADFNNDGLKDIITVEANNRIRIMCGSSTGVFQDKTSISGMSLSNVSEFNSPKLGDLDRDGLIDLVGYTGSGTNVRRVGFVKNKFNTGASVGGFTSILPDFPSNYEPTFQLFDYDSDNDLDFFLLYFKTDEPWPGGGYYYHPIKTYRNNGGAFTEVPTISPIKFAAIGFYPNISDYNQDGKFDIFGGKGDYSPNSSLFLPSLKNNGNGSFSDISSVLNFSSGSCYQSPPIENDFDLDGDVDYYQGSSGFGGCNGSWFFQNNNGVFAEVSNSIGVRINTGSDPNGAVGHPAANFFDLDNDGDLDFFGSSTNWGSNTSVSSFMRNNQTANNKWLKVDLNGCQSGKDGYYSSMMVKAANKKFYRIKYPFKGDGWAQSQLLHFGLGTASTIDSLVVKWPSGQTTILTNVQVNQTLTVNESQPTTLTASGALTFCQGGSVTLSTNTTGNQWYKNGTLIANQTGATLVVNSTGSYTVQGTSAAGCTSVSNAIQVTVNPAPSVPVVSANGPLTFCQGASVTLSNTTSGTKQWLRNNTAIPNQTGNSLSVNTPGSYTLRISNTNGCQSTSQASTVVVNPLPLANINSSGATTFCSGGSVTLTASGGGTYLWSNNQTTPAITVSASGSYVVTVTANGCSAKDTQAVVVNPQPVVTLNIPVGNFININQGPWPLNGSPAGGTYNGVGINNGLFSPSTTGLGSTQIGYTYTSAAGCTGSKSEKIIVYDTTGIVCTSYDTISVSVTDTLFINAVFTQVAPPNNRNTIKIYPNPANTQLTIDNGNYGLMQGYKIRVTNSLGQEVFFSPATQQQFDINLSTWTGMGVYFVHLIDNQGNTIQIKKIILQ